MQSRGIADLNSPDPASSLTAESALKDIRPPFNWWSRVIIPFGILAGALLLLLGTSWQALQKAEPVTVERAVLKSVAAEVRAGGVTVQASGWLEPDPYPYHVTALTSGIVQEILVLDGHEVAAGAVVARLVPDDARLELAAAEASLQSVEAMVEAAVASLAAARETWDNPVERRRALDTAKARLAVNHAVILRYQSEIAEQEAAVVQAVRNSRRLDELAAAQAVPVADAEDAESLADMRRARLEVLRQELSAARETEPQLLAERHAAERHLELRTDEKLALASAQAVWKQAQAGLEAAKIALAQATLRHDRLDIKAQMPGIVTRVHKAPGDKIMHGSEQRFSASIVSLYDPRSLQVRVDVPLAEAATVVVGQDCEVVVEVLPERKFAGRVTRIRHEADIQKNTLEVKVAVLEPSPELRPDMLSRVRFLPRPPNPTAIGGAETESMVFVPADAVQAGRVWIVVNFDGSRGTAVSRPAAPGLELDGWLAIPGLNPGDIVIRNPSPALRPGKRVRILTKEFQP